MDAWVIRNTKLLGSLGPAEQAAMGAICPDRKWTKGEFIYRSGDPADAMHIVKSGKVKVVITSADGHERIVGVYGPEDIFGESFLSDFAHRLGDAIALTDAVTCPIDRSQFLRLISEAPSIGAAFAKVLANRLAEAQVALEEASFAPVPRRVARAMLTLATRFGKAQGDHLVVDTDLTHDELAGLVGSTRVTVTNALAELRESGLVEGTRGSYKVWHRKIQDYLSTPIADDEDF